MSKINYELWQNALYSLYIILFLGILLNEIYHWYQDEL